MNKVIQQNIISPATALTASDGAKPYDTGEILVSAASSSLSLILLNAGLSTSLTVTYKIGYRNSSGTLVYITPADGGTITDLTAVNIAGSVKHASISVAPAESYQFRITNNDAVNAASVGLITMFQDEQ